MAAAAIVRTDGDIRPQVARDVGHGHIDSAEKTGIEREETGRFAKGPSVKDLDVRPRAGARSGDDVVVAVAVDVSDGNTDTAATVQKPCGSPNWLDAQFAQFPLFIVFTNPIRDIP